MCRGIERCTTCDQCSGLDVGTWVKIEVLVILTEWYLMNGYAASAAVDVPVQQRSIGCLNIQGKDGKVAQAMSRLSMMHSVVGNVLG